MHKYLALQAWNLYLAGPREWKVGVAQVSNAPADAIYQRHDSSWQVMSKLAIDHPFHQYYALCVAGGHVK